MNTGITFLDDTSTLQRFTTGVIKPPPGAEATRLGRPVYPTTSSTERAQPVKISPPVTRDES